MLQIERQEKILQYINNNKRTSTEQLATELGVSQPTIRRDIDSLDKRGLIRKVHGGAISVHSTSLHEIPYSDKVNVNEPIKQKIGAAAAKLIEPNDIIILDSGTTTLEVAKNIVKPNITVLTNDIKISEELALKDNVQTLVCGGLLHNSVYTLTGNMPVDFFKKFHVNKLFLGCDALDFSFGLSDRSNETADVKRAMIGAAYETILVTDSSKLNKKAFCYVCELSTINTIIIDKLEKKELYFLKEKGIHVIQTDISDRFQEILGTV